MNRSDHMALKNVNVEELAVQPLGLPIRSSLRSCSELRRCPPSLKLRRDSPAVVGDEAEDWEYAVRTPGLLIANETLYQLSYTPVIRTVRLARAADFSSIETSSALPADSAKQTETL